ncbi:hypothetical protein V6N13_040122 [Hibiscus sabdariffa]|uniref:Uncharacterized protein n=1 Tax=Hibiscus sabdariffa TaxID=183260 RepID=A0ABR2STS4_9ROSI
MVASYRHVDVVSCIQLAAKSISKEVGNLKNKKDDNIFYEENIQEIFNKDNYTLVGSNRDECNSMGLIDIHAIVANESSKSSSYLSEPTSLFFDKQSCLFLIKPRCIKSPRTFRSELDKIKFRASFNQFFGNLNNEKRRKVISLHVCKLSVLLETTRDDSPIIDRRKNLDCSQEAEAKLALDICNSIGLFFDTNDL